MLAKHRALLERTTVNQHLADALEDFADGAMDAARRTDQLRIVQSPSEADLTPYQTSIRVHDSTGARGHEDTPEG
jgi:capsule polysaccharide export protein KpsE/RkpR